MGRAKYIIFGLISFLICAVIIFSYILYSRSLEDERNVITPEEWQWLASHEGKIRVGTEPASPPLSFGEDGQAKGYIHDYLGLIEKKLNIRFQKVNTDSFAQMIEMAKSGEIDVVAGIIETPERANFFYFTRPVVEYPLVIIVESGRKDDFDVRNLTGMRIVATEGYSVVGYLRETYPNIDLHTLKNDFEAFKEVSFGQSDAVVTDLPTANSMISKWGFANLKVTADLGYSYKIRIASSIKKPELASILDKASYSLSEVEVSALKEKWQISGGSRLFLSKRFINFSIGVGSFMVLLLLFLLIWNRFLNMKIQERTRALDEHNRLLEEQVALKRNELKAANSYLSQALAEMNNLKRLIPICSKCKMVRDDEGFWNNVDVYLSLRTKAQFSHGICPDCAKKLYPEFFK